MTASTETAETPKRLPRWRRALVAILVIVSVVLVPLAGLSVWVRNLVLDTNHYVDTVAPLATNKAITDVVAKRATDRLFQQVDVEARAKDALPDRAQFLAGLPPAKASLPDPSQVRWNPRPLLASASATDRYVAGKSDAINADANALVTELIAFVDDHPQDTASPPPAAIANSVQSDPMASMLH